MRVLRGRAGTVDADREATDEMVDRAAAAGDPALRVWTPHRQVAFGRRDACGEGYDRARAVARRRGFRPVERAVGGRAVAFTGSTVAFALADPTADRTAIRSRYADAIDRLRRALAALGVDAHAGEPERSFCPGAYSLSADGKLAGVAQRVRRDAALVGGLVVVRDRGEVADCLEPVYDALGVPFDPASVGSVAAAGGRGDPTAVCNALVDAFSAAADASGSRWDV